VYVLILEEEKECINIMYIEYRCCGCSYYSYYSYYRFKFPSLFVINMTYFLFIRISLFEANTERVVFYLANINEII
jgi:hypothetical protein